METCGGENLSGEKGEFAREAILASLGNFGNRNLFALFAEEGQRSGSFEMDLRDSLAGRYVRTFAAA